jgi:hypothetical protein
VIEHRLPYGKHKGRPLLQVPIWYLRWVLKTWKLSSGLRAAVREALGLPAEPSPPPPRCQRCRNDQLRLTWHEQAGGVRQVRADCLPCRRFVSFVPLTPENVARADAAQPLAPLLDAMLQADAEGIVLVRRGDRVELRPCHRVSAKLCELVRQAGHQLVRHLPEEVEHGRAR